MSKVPAIIIIAIIASTTMFSLLIFPPKNENTMIAGKKLISVTSMNFLNFISAVAAIMLVIVTGMIGIA